MLRCREGQYDKDRIPIKSNVYDIPARLKSLSGSFFVMYNIRTKKFEIHDSSYIGSTLACVLPFDALDFRAIEYVRENTSRTTEEVAKEIDYYNEQLEKAQEAAIVDKANYKAKEAFNYLKNNSKTDSIPEELIRE